MRESAFSDGNDGSSKTAASGALTISNNTIFRELTLHCVAKRCMTPDFRPETGCVMQRQVELHFHSVPMLQRVTGNENKLERIGATSDGAVHHTPFFTTLFKSCRALLALLRS
jgi:hypothetical protein